MADQTNTVLADIEDIVPEIGSRSKVYELIGQGEIKAVKIGTRTKILMASFHDYVARLPAAQISPAAQAPEDRWLKENLRLGA